MKTTYAFILLASITLSCSSIKSITNKKGNFPLIGTIGKTETVLLNTEFTTIGQPLLERKIPLTLRVVPFTSRTFSVYSNARKQHGLPTAVQYIDSVESKPTYAIIEINDRIGLKETLNNAENLPTKSYLEKDHRSRLVSSMSVVLDDTNTAMLSDANGIFLTSDKNGLLQIETMHNNQKHQISIPKNQIFDYELLGICWGENNIGKLIIETFNDNGKCPEGTENNPRKLDGLYSLLKL